MLNPAAASELRVHARKAPGFVSIDADLQSMFVYGILRLAACSDGGLAWGSQTELNSVHSGSHEVVARCSRLAPTESFKARRWVGLAHARMSGLRGHWRLARKAEY